MKLLDLIGIIGSLASVVGLWLTYRIYRRVGDLVNRYMRLGLMPLHMKRLGGLTGNLEEASKGKDAEETRRSITLCREVLIAIRTLLNQADRGPTDNLIAEISAAANASEATLLTTARQVVIDLHGEYERLRLLTIQQGWRERDGV